MWAGYKGHSATMKVLLGKGADVNIKDFSGSTALMWVAIKGYTTALNALLDKGANVNIKRDDGMTALMLAVDKGHKNVVRILIRKGAKAKVKNNEGKTAWDYAQSKEIVKILKKTRMQEIHHSTKAKYKPDKTKWNIKLDKFGWARNDEGQSMLGIIVDIYQLKTKTIAQLDSSTVILHHSNKKKFYPYAILVIGIDPGISGSVVGNIYKGMISVGSTVYIGSEPESSPPFAGKISVDLVSGGYTSQDGAKIVNTGSYIEVNYKPTKTTDRVFPTNFSSREVLAIILKDDTSPGFANFILPKETKIRVGFLFLCKDENIEKLSILSKTLDLKH
jgi:hypothetical protein